jgi:hypothetical protein
MFRGKKEPEPPRIVHQVTLKARKGKAGLKYDSDFTVHIPNLLGCDWIWNIPSKSYIAYKSKPRVLSNGDEYFWNYVTPQDYCVDMISTDLRRQYSKSDQLGLAQAVLDFGLRIPYQERKPCYVKYPLETLCEHGGNCADLSVLTASMLTNLSIDCCFILPPGHVLVGAAVPAEGTHVEFNGKKYYLFEPTGTDWPNEPAKGRIGEEADFDLKKVELQFRGRRDNINKYDIKK